MSAILKGFDRSVVEAAKRLEQFLHRPGALPILIILIWACAVLPNLTVRSFIYEEGTNAEIARDVLANGHFLQPFVYGIRWHEKPSLLGWLIAGFALAHRRSERMVGEAAGDDLGLDHSAAGAAGDAALRKFDSIVIRGAVLRVLSAAVAEIDDRRARYRCDRTVVCRLGVVVGGRGFRPCDDSALDRLRRSPCRGGHGQGTAAGGILRDERSGLFGDRETVARSCRVSSFA